MHEERIEFTQRHEDKPAMVQARMWHHEIWFVDDPLAVEQDVQIDGPGARSVLLIPAERALDFTEDSQEAFRRDICLKLHDPVQEPAVTRSGMIVHGLGFIEQRYPYDLRVWQQAQQRHRTIAEIDSIADIRAKSDEDRLAIVPR